MHLVHILSLLAPYPHVLNEIRVDQLTTFIELCQHLKPTIALRTGMIADQPPEGLPVTIHEFLRRCTGLSSDALAGLWEHLNGYIWPLSGNDARANAPKYLPLFLEHGLDLELGFIDIYPPTSVCLNPACFKHTFLGPAKLRLGEPQTHRIITFTADVGPVPGWASSLYCRNCRTSYYPEYYVHSHATIRSYYAALPLPETIQVSLHYHFERRVCQRFSAAALFSWSSATNFARMYNPEYARRPLPMAWSALFPCAEMDHENVYDAFFIHQLLIDHRGRDVPLELSHSGTNCERLRPALEERNKRMAGPGQPLWNHACDGCCKIYTKYDGTQSRIRSGVTDGVCIGHLCCSYHDCKNRLESNTHRFCAKHKKHNFECVVMVGGIPCGTPVDEGYKTCSNPAHRAVEAQHRARGTAMFQLKKRLQTGHTAPPEEVDPTASAADEEFKLDGDVQSVAEELGVEPFMLASQASSQQQHRPAECPDKPATGTKSVRARFGRRRTNNEELCVLSCVIILGRATFYGSEAPNGVIEFWKGLFPEPESLPEVLWFDNNCKVQAVLKNPLFPDKYFEHCALPVDVFHFKCKHKESDGFCAAHCNPALWPELRDGDCWVFNSSAAEQTNAWFGGYAAIVREMRVERHNFFLDEMIRLRNEWHAEQLRRRGKNPYFIPLHELRPSLARA